MEIDDMVREELAPPPEELNNAAAPVNAGEITAENTAEAPAAIENVTAEVTAEISPAEEPPVEIAPETPAEPELQLLDLKPVVEALLFVTSDPVSIDKIQEIVSGRESGLKIEKKDIRSALIELQTEYENRHSAVQLVEVAGGWQFCTKAEFAVWLEKLAKNKEVYKLSNSALETLSIIAYRQPITRAEVEHIRGVDSGGVMHSLLEKRLVKITGRKDCIGHPLLYGTTAEFLQYFGLAGIADLPLLEDLNKA